MKGLQNLLVHENMNDDIMIIALQTPRTGPGCPRHVRSRRELSSLCLYVYIIHALTRSERNRITAEWITLQPKFKWSLITHRLKKINTGRIRLCRCPDGASRRTRRRLQMYSSVTVTLPSSLLGGSAATWWCLCNRSYCRCKSTIRYSSAIARATKEYPI